MAKTHRIRKLSRASRLFGARFRVRYPLPPGIMREGFPQRGYAADEISEFDGFSPSGGAFDCADNSVRNAAEGDASNRPVRPGVSREPPVRLGWWHRAPSTARISAPRDGLCAVGGGLGRILVRLATRNFQPLSTLRSFRPCVLAPRGSEGGGGSRSAVYCQPVSALVKARA